ncbi:DgyrCDS3589 [Dimorphilus gyrociliatus]|uniref:DgyrCDS3589 n=1 Tax=Dimorphilus gyrociliatus TaxID=2664684 RepID=A0A7I8VGE1_9ANNE|nr:DgyrCDS3589 [Dimorphilus gyrociliatus]
MTDAKKLLLRKKGKAPALDELAIIGAFKAFDKNNDGYISLRELKEVMQSLGENLNDTEIKNMMAAADENNDGRISFEEFDSMIKQGLKIKENRDETRLNLINSSVESGKSTIETKNNALLWPHLAP